MSPTYSEVEETRSEELREMLCTSPSLFGRLVAIATLRDFNPRGLEVRRSPGEFQRTVNALHRNTFISWLNLSLKQQKADLTIYLSRIGTNPRALASLLSRVESLIPPDATESERDLFVGDISIAYAMFRPEWEKEPASQGEPEIVEQVPIPSAPLADSGARAA